MNKELTLTILFTFILSLMMYWNMELRNNNIILMDDLNCTQQQNQLLKAELLNAYNELEYAESWRAEIKEKFPNTLLPCPPLKENK